MTWRGRSVQCCTYHKWVYLRCSLLSFSRFKTLCSSHFSSCTPCFFWKSNTYQHCAFLFGLLQLVYLYCAIWPISVPLLMQHPRLTLAFKPLTLTPPALYLFPPLPSPHPHVPSFYSIHSASSFPDSLRILQWNAVCL